MMKNLPKQKSSVNQNQLSLAIEDAPPRVRAYGLSEAHARPLVAVRDEGGAGRIVSSRRVSQSAAWQFSDLEYTHSATAWAALVVDVDAPEKLREILHGQTGLLPNWIVTNKKNQHSHVAYTLADPVLLHPSANIVPLEYLADVEKKLIVALDGDPAYSGALARNPIVKPRWRTQSLWFRKEPWTLEELDNAATWALPEDWKPATATPGAVGRNCAMFEGLMAWAGREAHRFESILMQAKAINATFSSPLPAHEVKATVKSVAKYRRRWEANGWHSPQWIRKQSARGKMSGAARKPGSNEALMPWDDEGISRRTWYRRRAKVGGESRRRKSEAKVMALEPTQGDVISVSSPPRLASDARP